MPDQVIENLPEPVKKQRRYSLVMGVFGVIWAVICFLLALGIMLHWPVASDLLGTNPRAAIVVAVIGGLSLMVGIATVHQANSAERLKEMTYGQSDERYQLIRLKASAAMGMSFFCLVPFAILGLKMTNHLDIAGMTVLLGVWLASLAVGGIALAYYRKRL